MRLGFRFDRPSAAMEGVSAWRHPSRDICCGALTICQLPTTDGTNNDDDDDDDHTRSRVSAAALREWRRPSSFPSRVA